MDAHLSNFGITHQENEQGKSEWIINVVVDGAESKLQSAYFDEQLGVWRLRPHVNGTLSCQSSPPSPDLVIQSHKNNPSLTEIDWTDTLPSSAHIEFLLNLDWATTPLGPCRSWPNSLQLYTHMLLSDPRAGAIYWGPQRISIYNEPLIPLIGVLHPALMGNTFEEVMPSLWDFFGPIFHSVEKHQRGFIRDGLELPVMRHGYMEETWWDGGLIPLKDDLGGYGGVYFSWTEVTRTILRDRRTKMIHRLGQLSTSTVQSMWRHIHDVFIDYPRDVPMAVMYSVDENNHANGRLHLEYTIGMKPSYKNQQSNLHFVSAKGDAPFAPLLHCAQNTSADFVTIDLAKEAVDLTALQDVDWRGFGEPSRHLVVIPLKSKTLVRGYIILGLNPRRDFDADHEQFIIDLVRQLKETVIRGALEGQVQEREDELRAELSESERRISRMAEIVPVGIYELAANGSLHWANDQFFEILGVPHDLRNKSIFAWKDYIHPADHDRADKEMERSLAQGVGTSDSLRLRRKYEPSGLDLDARSTSEPFWILYSASPSFNPDGSVHSLTGSITNISHIKWAEQLQILNADTARKERQIQEEFIDITSHEMRNPLSAITQSADGVLLSLRDAQNLDSVQSLMEIIKQNAEAAESILFCAAHQRRIIDDVLTLGKLDSKLLNIAPAPFYLQDLVNQSMRMFKTECDVNQIEIQTLPDGPMPKAKRSAVVGDSSRLLQVLVNLLTNAIKFTKTQTVKKIGIRYGSSPSIPTADLFGPGFSWHSTGSLRPDPTQEPDYGQGDVVYIYYAVTDSGKGIPSDSLDRVFTKFEQADRRTHVEYGGSGLGLYISRELTEMQGGFIGIESAIKAGSTFAFYAKVRYLNQDVPQEDLLMNNKHRVLETTQSFTALDLENKPTSATLLHSRNYNILLVEDNLLNQKVLAKQLRKLGCNVIVANHGGEAVDILLQMHGCPTEYGSPLLEDTLLHFDCILMDWEMPICDGIQATKAIRNIELQQGTARNLIIGVTANARAEQIVRAIEAGMDSVVPKPFRVTELLVRIDDIKNHAVS